jgi:hypothetical protein
MFLFFPSFLLLQLGVGWEIIKVNGEYIYITAGEKTFRISSLDSILTQVSDFGVKLGKKSRVFLQRQNAFKPTLYLKVILDEQSYAFFSKPLTFYYGKILVDMSEFQSEKQVDEQIIRFYDGFPYYVELIRGKVVILSLDRGYLLYCIKCEGSIWRITEDSANKSYESESYESEMGVGKKKERGVVEKDLIPRKVFLISKDKVEESFADDELFSLFEDLIKRMEKEKFAKDIIYSDSYDVPEPISPKKKKFEEVPKENTDLPSLRHFILIELQCFELKKQGKDCKAK